MQTRDGNAIPIVATTKHKQYIFQCLRAGSLYRRWPVCRCELRNSRGALLACQVSNSPVPACGRAERSSKLVRMVLPKMDVCTCDAILETAINRISTIPQWDPTEISMRPQRDLNEISTGCQRDPNEISMRSPLDLNKISMRCQLDPNEIPPRNPGAQSRHAMQ